MDETRGRITPEVDRALIVGGALWLAFVGGAAANVAGGETLDPSTAAVVGVGTLLAAALILLGMGGALNRGWRRATIAVGAGGLLIGAVAIALFLAGRLVPAAALAIGTVALLAGAVRHWQRPSPSMLDRLAALPTPAAGMAADEPAWAETPAPAGPLGDLSDDPALFALMAAVARLSPEMLRLLSAQHRTVADDDRRDALERAGRSLTTDRRTVLAEVADIVERWGRGASGSPATWEWGTMRDIDQADLRRAAMPAILDAALAILARPQLDEADRELLLGPWESATMARVAAARVADAQAADDRSADTGDASA